MRWNYYKLRHLFYYKVRHGLLQIATGITKCDDYYKLRQYRRRSNFTLGLHAEIPVRVVPEYRMPREGIKNGGRQKQICSLGPSALFTGINNYLSAELVQLTA